MAALEITSGDNAGLSWRDELPSLAGERVLLRELRAEDARSLFRIVRTPEVSRYTWPPPATIEQFENFIDWTHSERACGKYICFGIVPSGGCEAVGLFELRQMQPGFLRAELGFFIDPALFGRGLFSDAARLVLNFAFHVVGIHRVEARVAVENDRSNNALSKIGARQEGVLRAAFIRGGRYVDQYLWAIVSTSYQQHDDRPPHARRASHRRLRS
jgi:ribosomal-protein-alanine N-acetyltransferase